MRSLRVVLLVGVLVVAGLLVAGLWLSRNDLRSESGSRTSLEQALEPLPPLVFVRGADIWRSDAGQAAPRQLTKLESPSYALHPTLSPDGLWLTYVVIGPPTAGAELPLPSSKLYIMRSDGSEQRVLWNPPQGLIGLSSWTQDSRSLYVGIGGMHMAPAALGGMQLLEIVKIDVDTGTAQPVLEDAQDPTLSPDGTLLAYLKLNTGAAADQAVTMTLEVTTLDGLRAHQVLDGTRFQALSAPRFSPDGTQIVFAAVGGPETDAHSLPARPATTPAAVLDRVLAWLTPSATAHGQLYDIWVINTDGTGLRRLTRLNEDQPMAVFAPDGTELVIMGGNGIYRLNTDGSRLRKIDPQGGHGGLDWLPR
jgi:hypothetical protein